MLAPRRPINGPVHHGQTEFFEYHWSYKMQGNRLADFVPTLLRLMWRTPRTVPAGLKVIWWLAWLIVVLLVAVVAATIITGVRIENFTLAGALIAIFGQGVIAVVLLKILSLVGGLVTQTFVDVARYLDRSPRSYAVRREIREGMVDLLRAIHEDGRYSRVIVAAHSLGGYIAYDGLTSYWSELHGAKARIAHPGPTAPFAHLADLERLAVKVDEMPSNMTILSAEERTTLDQFRQAQFDLWKDCRNGGNPWLVTDFITFGTPLYFADLLLTKNRTEFLQLAKNSEMPQCPPRADDEMVEGTTNGVGRGYGFVLLDRQSSGAPVERHYLTHGALFAVVRWANAYFPAEKGFFGDWFGGALRPLFGRGILDLPISGNLPGRRAPGVAHGRYFSYPDAREPNDVAAVLQSLLRLELEDELPPTDGGVGSPL